jgi:bisanhydrobacterioruberin hydratase
MVKAIVPRHMSTIVTEKIIIRKGVVAISIALLFHLTGLMGILLNQPFFVENTVLNLVLMFLLLLWTQAGKKRFFFLFVLLAYGIGFLSEYIGVSTGILFGEYYYGSILGWQYREIPLIIGINWFIVLYCCGITSYYLLKIAGSEKKANRWTRLFQPITVAGLGATMAVLFDWVMEPVAIKLGFWYWKDGEVPLLNYQSWWGISFFALLIFNRLNFSKDNVFAVHLLLIQTVFFLFLRLLL